MHLEETTNTATHHDEQLAKLAASTPCAKDHECIKSGLQKIGKVECAARVRVLFCLECDKQCQYWMSFGQGGLCKCPIRRYVAMHLEAGLR